MGKKNKVRYHSHGNPFPKLTMTGKLFLRHRDEEVMAAAEKGDLQVYISTDSLLGGRRGDYDAMGHEGYLKADVFDGKGWKPLSLEEFFSDREYYFGKRERPSDTYALCHPILVKAAGTLLMRTYREHYVKAPPSEE
jgi:hypothetical protein